MKLVATCTVGLLVVMGCLLSESMGQTTPGYLRCAEGSDLFYPAECRNGTGAEFPVYFPFPYDCTQFFECSNGIARCIKCSDGTRWDQKNLICNHQGAVDCNIVTTTTTTRRPVKAEDPIDDDVCPEGYEGLIPHPSDCRLFYYCDVGQSPCLFECPDGLYFNPTIGTCDYPHNVPDCQGEHQPMTNQNAVDQDRSAGSLNYRNTNRFSYAQNVQFVANMLRGKVANGGDRCEVIRSHLTV